MSQIPKFKIPKWRPPFDIISFQRVIYEKNSDQAQNIFEVKKEQIIKIIATFEDIIQVFQATPISACLLTCYYYRPSIYAFQLINEYHSTNKVLLTYKKNGSAWKIMINQGSMKVHPDFANYNLQSQKEFDVQCQRKYQENMPRIHAFFMGKEDPDVQRFDTSVSH